MTVATKNFNADKILVMFGYSVLDWGSHQKICVQIDELYGYDVARAARDMLFVINAIFKKANR